MKKKLLAAAIAGAFAVPGVALAAGSSVTISGFFKVGIESYNIGSSSVGRANSSEWRLTDNSSRIIFSVKEDLGGGLSAIGQVDTRFNPTNVGGGTWGSGNTWVGMHSDQWGNVTLGNRDLHYFHTADTIPGGATALDAWSVGLLGFVNGGGGLINAPIASDSRTPNVIEYASPKWGIFDFGLAWSANRAGSPSDMGPAGASKAYPGFAGTGGPVTRKGQAWNFAPEIHTGPWWLGYSYWNSKADPVSSPAVVIGGVTVTPAVYTEPDQRSDRIWGFYKFPQGFYVGFTWDKSRLNDASTGTRLAERNAWSLPLSYSWGPHSIGYTYTRANDDQVVGSGTGAKLNSLYYQYALSKSTQVAVTYANLNNDSKAAYNLFATGLGSTDVTALAPGEDPRALQFTLNHSF